MATSDQRRALLAIPCPRCHAAPDEVCSISAPGSRASRDVEGGVRRGRRIPISTLDGGCHDARWQAAGLGTAPVLADRVRELQPPRERPAEPVSAGSVDDRPW